MWPLTWGDAPSTAAQRWCLQLVPGRAPAGVRQSVAGREMAMAPVAVQCFWSMRVSNARRTQTDADAPFAPTDDRSAEAAAWRYNIGSCHVWAADGEHVAAV